MAAKLSRYPDGAYASCVFYVLYGAGSVTTKAKLWTSGVNDRKLAGLGLGLRYSRTTWGLDAVVAWRDQGVNRHRTPPLPIRWRGWVSLTESPDWVALPKPGSLANISLVKKVSETQFD